jgi:hypothetical protein
MSRNPAGYEPTRVMRDAVEMAPHLIEGVRSVAKRSLGSFSGSTIIKKHDASSLANLAVKAVTEAYRKKG